MSNAPRPTISIAAIHARDLLEETEEYTSECQTCGAPEGFITDDCLECQGIMSRADIEEEDRRDYEAAVLAGW